MKSKNEEPAELQYHGKPISKLTKKELIEALTVAVNLYQEEQQKNMRWHERARRWGI